MKSGRKHDLETNELARRLAALVEFAKPYSTAIVSGLLAVICLWIVVQLVTYSRASYQREIWEEFSLAVEAGRPDMEVLRQSVEQHQGTALQEWSQITMADGLLLQGTRYYLQNRDLAVTRLDEAASYYQSLISTAKDPRIRDRAHFGLGRVYEVRGELDRARQEYSLVSGAFAEMARQRIEALLSPAVIETYAWLATAEPPTMAAPMGPGTPGVEPFFGVDPFDIPDAAAGGSSLQDVLDRLGRSTDITGDAARYQGEVPGTETPATTPPPGGGLFDLPLEPPPTEGTEGTGGAVESPATPSPSTTTDEEGGSEPSSETP